MGDYQVLYPLLFVLACVIAARFFFPAHWSPVLALALFMPYVTYYHSIQIFMPVSVLLIPGVFFGFCGRTMFFVYAPLIFIPLISRYQSTGSLLSLMKYSVGSVLIWLLVVNFGVYLNGHDGSSLAPPYLLALPFDLRLLMSPLFFSLLFYRAWAPKEYFLRSAENAKKV
jgi:hypothetical protein